MRSNRPTRLLALLLVPACIGLAACGGDDEAPDTQVIVPTPTPQVQTADPSRYKSADGYLIAVNNRQLALRTRAGDAVFLIDRADREALGIAHMQSHAGTTSVGFRVFYDRRGKAYYAKGAVEIPPPF